MGLEIIEQGVENFYRGRRTSFLKILVILWGLHRSFASFLGGKRSAVHSIVYSQEAALWNDAAGSVISLTGIARPKFVLAIGA
jgi:hypothetical protein